MNTPHTPAVRLGGVTKFFGDVHAVRGIDLEIQPGEMVAFLGPNGAGKTTTIDMVLGLSRPTAGEVEVFGMAPREAIARGLVAAVMQTGGLLKDLTVRETVQYTASLFADTKPVDAVLESAGIAEIANRKVGKCSGGEQQRLRFAMALLSDPALLLLDEPTTGMDVEGRRSFWNAIREDASQGRAVLFATHYLEEADLYADRIVLISNGTIVADGTGSEIKALASGRTVRATWGRPDVEGRRSFWNAIRDDAQQGRAVLFATHYLEEADLYADRIILISNGGIVADGTGSEIKALASGRTVRATLARPDTGALGALGGVEHVEVRGEQVFVRAQDSDLVARYLLTETDARDLEITTHGLEDAFLSLTGRTTSEAGSAARPGPERDSDPELEGALR